MRWGGGRRMHALASKAVNKDRELSSRSKFYYEVEENETCFQKFKKYIRNFVTFFFTQVQLLIIWKCFFKYRQRTEDLYIFVVGCQVGVIVLISVYMLSGAALFHHVERDSLMEVAEEARTSQRKASLHLWNITGGSQACKSLKIVSRPTGCSASLLNYFPRIC